MNKLWILSIVCVLALLLAAIGGPGLAQEPAPQAAALTNAFTYQGQLNKGGNPVNSTCNMRFTLYDALNDGSQVGSTLTRSGVSVTNGLFTVPDLDFGSQYFGETRWLAVEVQCTGDGSYTPLSPRQALTAPPYAFYWGGTWTGSGTGLTLQGGSAGLTGKGTTWGVSGTSTTGIGVYGVAGASSGTNPAVYGWSSGAGGRGVLGWADATTGATFGVRGEAAATAGHGVHGYASATSGPAWGVWGETNSTGGGGVRGEGLATTGSAYGVYGRSLSTGGSAVYGWAGAASGTTYGIRGESQSPSGRGVYGEGSSTTGTAYGVYGRSYSYEGTAVYGYASATTGTTYGVYGKVMAPNGVGVYGEAVGLGVKGTASHSAGIGVHGSNQATTGDAVGVYGATYSPTGRGVKGKAWSAGGSGVYGEAASSTANYGVYSYGNTGATGTKSAIVQTQDYGWRHLYAVESPQVLFEDVGTAQLVGGRAVVQIDPVFAQTVNLDEPYQVFLTPLGDCGLYAAEKTPTSFTVRALDGRECSVGFDYRIIATRLGYESLRLAPAQDPTPLVQPEGMEAQP